MDYLRLKEIIPRPTHLWTREDVASWLRFIGLDSLVNAFWTRSIDGRALSKMTQVALKQDIKVGSNISLKKLLNWINKGIKEFNDQDLTDIPLETQRTSKTNKQGVENQIVQMEEEANQLQGDTGGMLQLTLQRYQTASTVYYSIQQEGGKIGRHSSTKICIPDQSVSREHAEVTCKDKKFYIKDIGSMGGTFIKVDRATEIPHDTIFEAGQCQFRVDIQEDKVHVIIHNNLHYETKQVSLGENYKIGRKGHAPFTFPKDSHMSVEHCEIWNTGNKLFLQDSGSTNGTWIRLSSQQKRSEYCPVSEGTVVRIGANNAYLLHISEMKPKIEVRPCQDVCNICYQSQKDCVYLPCKHYSSCVKCSKHLKVCPLCRTPIQDLMKIYLE